MDKSLLDHIIEIKERLASIETKVEAHNHFNERVNSLEKDMVKVRTSVHVFKWIIGIVAAVSAAVIKQLKF